MTFVKATALTLVLAGTFALGLWASPYVVPNRWAPTINPTPQAAEASHATATPPASSRPRAGGTTWTARAAAIPTSSPELWNRVRPLLNAGTNRQAAAE